MTEISINSESVVRRSGTSGFAPAMLRLEIGAAVEERRPLPLSDTMDDVRR